MKLKLASLILFLFSGQLLAIEKTDSILGELNLTQENKARSLLLNQLAHEYRSIDIDSSFYFAKEGFKLANEINYSLGIAENSASIGDFYVVSDSLNEAKAYYIESIEYFQQLEMFFDAANILKIVGNIYLSQNNYSEALIYYQESQRLSEENDFQTILPHLYNNIALIYNALDEKEKSLEYFNKAYEGFKAQSLKREMAFVLFNLGDYYYEEKNIVKADEYYRKTLDIFIETKNLIDAASVYAVLSNNSFNKGRYELSLEYLQKGYDLYRQQSMPYSGPKSLVKVRLLAYLGRTYSSLGKTSLAINYLNEAMDLATQNNYLTWIEFCAYEMSTIYEKKGDTKQALNYFKIYEQFGDSILNESSIKKITQLEMQYAFDENIKERELEASRKETEQQRKEFIYLIILIIGLFVTAFAILLYINQRNKASKVELQKKNLTLKHEQLQQKLEHRDRELATNVMFLLKKNEFITYTAERLAKLKNH